MTNSKQTSASAKKYKKRIEELETQQKITAVMVCGLIEAICGILPDLGNDMQEQIEHSIKQNGLEQYYDN